MLGRGRFWGIVFIVLLVAGCGRDKSVKYSGLSGFTGNWVGCWGWAGAGSDTIPGGRVWADLVAEGEAISGRATSFYFGLFDTPHYQRGEVSGGSEKGRDFEGAVITEEGDTITFVGTLSGAQIQGTYSSGGSGGNYTLRRGAKRVWEGTAEGMMVYDSLNISDTTYLTEVSLSLILTEAGWGDSILLGGEAFFFDKGDTFAFSVPAEGKILPGDSLLFHFPGTMGDALHHQAYSLFSFWGHLQSGSDAAAGEWHTRTIGSHRPFGLWAIGRWRAVRGGLRSDN